MTTTEVRTCERDGCTRPVAYRHRDSDARHARRRYCGRACYLATVTFTPPTARCRTCGTEFGPAPTERPGQFVKRNPRFCSQRCNGAAKTAAAAAVRTPRPARKPKPPVAAPRPPKAGLSVFGDPAPPRPWRPSGFAPLEDQ